MATPEQDAEDEIQPLVVTHDQAGAPSSRRAAEALAMLLLIKICSNAYVYQMLAYDRGSAEYDNGTSTTICRHHRKPGSAMHQMTGIGIVSVTFLLPAVGGALSDTCLGCLLLIWVGTALQLCGSGLQVTLDYLGVVCQLPMYLLCWAAVLLNLSATDSPLIYGLVQFARNGRSRQLLLHLYFAAAATGESLGYLPTALRFLTGHELELIGLVFGCCRLVCMSHLASGQPAIARVRFQLPRPCRIRRFYLIAAGTIPYLTCVSLCRITLYWQQLRFFTQAKGDEDVAASYVGLIGYQTATISLSSLAAIAVFRGWMPRWLSLRLRIRIGLCLMALTKVPLLLISALDYTGAVKLEGSCSFITLWSVYFIFSFCDGVTNVFTTVAIYELICCIAEKSAKATFIGIFYTVWGLAILLNGAILLILQGCEVLSLDTGVRTKPKAHFSYAAVICLTLIAIGYWEKISWPLAEGLLADHEAEEAEGAEEDEGCINS